MLKLAEVLPQDKFRRMAFVGKFWSKVEIGGDDDCWNWTGARVKDPHGNPSYGEMRIPGHGPATAHRIALYLSKLEKKEKWIDTLCVLHSCDNPACCNPSHLRQGTQQENMKDMVSRDRNVGNKKLTDDQVMQIRHSWADGDTAKQLSKTYSITINSVGNIVYGRTWKNLPLVPWTDL